jgi:ELWxxDGT repeat protein
MRLSLSAALLSLLLPAAAPVLAAEPYMVKDIDPLPRNQSSFPRSFLSLDNGIALFGANLAELDAELWRSDGTPGGTYQLSDTCATWYCKQAITGIALAGDRLFYLAATRPGEQNAAELWVTGGSASNTFDLGGPFYLDPYNAPIWVKSRGLLFFLANDIAHGMQLWRSDGTRAGTYRLTDLRPDQGRPAGLTELRGKLYFASPGPKGWALWASDGTPRGTKLLKEGSFYALRSIGSALIFFGPGPQGWNLWRSDGTTKGTVRFATISPIPQDLELIEVVALAGRYYFTTHSETQGEELWASDGTQAGTRRLTNFANPMVFHYYDEQVWHPLYLPVLAMGSRMVFAADDGVHGAEPWVTDGTPAGTRLLRDVCPGSCWSWPTERKVLGSRLIFDASSSAQGQEPWVTDGTPAGTRLLRDICPGACHSFFFGLVDLGGGLLFGATDGQNGFQLWKTNGTPRGTTRITAFPEDVSAVKRIGAPIPGGILYSAYSRQHGEELWRTDGTAAGTSLVLDLIDRDNGGSRPGDLFALGGRLYFLADDGIHGRELWTSDGTGPGTSLVHDTPPYDDFDTADILARIEVGGIAYLARATSEGNGIWRTDGTAAGSFRLTPETLRSAVYSLQAAGSRLFFIGRGEGDTDRLWTSDGTAAGTHALDPQPRSGLTPYQGSVFFRASTEGAGEQIWKSDGTPANTGPVPWFGEGVQVVNTDLLGEFAGRLWFKRWAEGFGYELWSTDGTEAGTRMLADIRPGNDSFAVETLLPAGSRMFLKANGELWGSDGTAAGTRRLGPGGYLDLTKAVFLNGRLFYAADEGSTSDLWVSDGSVSGTKLLQTAAGERLTSPSSLVAFAGRLWFLQGGKIWSTDGTPAGTVPQLSFDVQQFTGGDLTPAGNRLFFSGWTPETGHELWAVDPQ